LQINDQASTHVAALRVFQKITMHIGAFF